MLTAGKEYLLNGVTIQTDELTPIQTFTIPPSPTLTNTDHTGSNYSFITETGALPLEINHHFATLPPQFGATGNTTWSGVLGTFFEGILHRKQPEEQALSPTRTEPNKAAIQPRLQAGSATNNTASSTLPMEKRAYLPLIPFSPKGNEQASKSVAGPFKTTNSKIKELKAVLADGGSIQPFVFHTRSGEVRARNAGLEGFLYRKLELERRQGEDSLLGQWNDHFSYLDTLFSLAPWTTEARRQLAELRIAPGTLHDKNLSLNALLVTTARDWQERLTSADASSWSRQASVYMILARSYNRMKPGKNFFDSLDDAELERIRRETRTNVLWLLDVFEIGDVGKWGPLGSPYALKGYRFKKELGGEEGARRFIARAKQMGFRVGFDEIPNHTAIDSDQAELQPQDFIHLLPPTQPGPGTDLAEYTKTLLAQIPHHIPGVYSPLYQLRQTKHYPGHEGRPFWVLIHQPVTDYGDGMWLDMLQRDYSRQSARDWGNQRNAASFHGYWR